MSNVLPQQALLLEMLIMSGRLAIAKSDHETILWRTVNECKDNGWLTLEPVGDAYEAADITDLGRTQVKQHD